MKNLLRFLLLTSLSYVCLPPPLALAQLVGPKSITSTQQIQIDTNGLATVSINVAGTWTGTLQPQGTIGGQTAFNVQVSPAGSISPASTITANGAYVLSVAGLSSFQLVGNTVATGTAVVYLNGSIAGGGSSSSGGSSGGGTANGLAIALSGATAPSPVGTDTCAIGSPAIWSQNAAGTYQTQGAIDPLAGVLNFTGTPGFLTLCRPIFFNSSGVTPSYVFNGQAFNVYTLFSNTKIMSEQHNFENTVADASTYNLGNLNRLYSEMHIYGTPTVNSTFVANSRVTFEDQKTGGVKPHGFSAYQAAVRKHTAYDITNCAGSGGGMGGAVNNSCYIGYYGDVGLLSSVTVEDETGATYSVFEGLTSNIGTRGLNATGMVFHATKQTSAANRFPTSYGFYSEDQGATATNWNFFSAGTPGTSGWNNFVGWTGFGTATQATHTVDVVGTLGLGSAQQTTTTSGGLVDKYSGITTAGLGFPVEVARVRAVSQVSAIGTTTLLATGSATTDYLLIATVYCDSTSAAATVAITISYTDPGSQAQTITPTAAACTALGSSSFALINSPIAAKNGTNIQYSTAIANTPTYDVRIDLYQLGTN